MKKYFLLITAAAMALSGVISLAENPSAGDWQNFKEQHEKIAEQMRQQAHQFQKDIEAMRAQAGQNSFGDAFSFTLPSPFPMPGQEESFLIVPTKSADPQQLSQIREDMQIMYTILTENVYTLDSTAETIRRNRIYMSVFAGDSQQKQAMYLQDFGVVFFLDVDFPLVPLLEQKTEQPQPEESEEDQLWNQTRRKLRGQSEPATGSHGTIEIQYDAEKVKRLQENVFEVYKHAANIGGLEPDDKIVFMAQFRMKGSQIYIEKVWKGKNQVQIENLRQVPSSYLVLTALKKDIDAYAQKKIDQKAFIDKVTILNY